MRTRILVTALSAIALLSCGALPSIARHPPAAQPIPSGPQAHVRSQDQPARLAWGRRHLVEGYDRFGLRNPKWDREARRLIELSVMPLIGTAFETPHEERVAAGRAAVAAGCNDPLVLYLLGRAVWAADADSAEPEQLFRQAVEGMKTVPYERAIARYTATSLFSRYANRNEGIQLRAPLRDLELAWFQQSLNDGSYAPDDDAVLIWQLMNGAGIGFFNRSHAAASAAMDKAEWVDPWVRLHFSGLHHIDEAWAARGQGWAKDTKPESWEVFRRLSALARRDLEESWRLRPDRPEAAYEMIQVSQDAEKDGEDCRFWFDRTVRAQMDFTPAYEAMRVHLLPRWGGSYAEMLSFAREAVDTGRFDTDVPLELLHTVMSIRKDQRDENGGGGQPIFERRDTYPSLEKMLERYLSEPSRAGEKNRFEAIWAVVADRAGKPEDALRHLKTAGYRLTQDAEFYVEEEESPAEFVTRVVLQGGAAAADVAQGDQLRDKFDMEGALAAYRAALARDISPQAAAALAHKIAQLEQERRLEKGEWVSFLPTSADLAGWKTELGSWRVERDGSLIGLSGARGLLLVSDARVGPDFEIRGRMELVSSTNDFYQGGVAFGYPSWKSQDWMSFRIKRNAGEGKVAYLSQHMYRAAAPPPQIDVANTNTFLVRVQGGKFSATVNGVSIQKDVPLTHGLVRAPDLRVGFGGYVDENVFSLRFRGIELRRLL